MLSKKPLSIAISLTCMEKFRPFTNHQNVFNNAYSKAYTYKKPCLLCKNPLNISTENEGPDRYSILPSCSAKTSESVVGRSQTNPLQTNAVGSGTAAIARSSGNR